MLSRVKSFVHSGFRQLKNIRRRTRDLVGHAVQTTFMVRLRNDFDRLSAMMQTAKLEQIRRNFKPIDSKHQEIPLYEQDSSYHPAAWRLLVEHQSLGLNPGELFEDDVYTPSLPEFDPSTPKFHIQLDNAIMSLTPAMMAGNYRKVMTLYQEMMFYHRILTEYQKILSQKLFERDVSLAKASNVGDSSHNDPDDERVIYRRKMELPHFFDFASESDFRSIETCLRRLHSSMKASLDFLFEQHPLFDDVQITSQLKKIEAILKERSAAIAKYHDEGASVPLNAIILESKIIRVWLEDAKILLSHFPFDDETPVPTNSKIGILQERVRILESQQRAMDQLNARVVTLREARPNPPTPEVFQ